jgi:hypothetical protein
VRRAFQSLLLLLLFSNCYGLAQDPTKPADPQSNVRVNYINVCTPTEDEQKEISAALAKIPKRPQFGTDFEISRGLTTMENADAARYVRLRRDMPEKSGFSTAQYSLSTDAKQTTETLVLRLSAPKDLLMISFEDQVSSTATQPAAILATDTPVSRVKLERFGKSSLVLARCEGADQATYDPLFREASQLMVLFRKSLGLRTAFRRDLAWLTAPPAVAKPTKKPETKPESK